MEDVPQRHAVRDRLYGRPGEPPTSVAAFRIDRDAATRGEFAAFVRAHPEWRRGRVRPTLAAVGGYLADWNGDLDAGTGIMLRRPVTGVSWFAAQAYCTAQGKRLPTLAEWEYVAAASERARDASRDPAFMQRLLSLYAARPRPLPAVNAGFRNIYGVRGLHGLAWEWVADFDGAHGANGGHDSRGPGHDLSCASAAIGTADPNNYPAFLRYAVRAGLTRRTTLGALVVAAVRLARG